MPVISTNTAANTALRYLNDNSSMQSSSLSKISSGRRIERASDDAAGLAVSTQLRSDIAALEQAAINADQGIAVLQTADGALARIGDIMNRMVSSATQAISGSVDDTARGYIDAEYQELIEEIDAIAQGTRFGNAALLDASYQEDFLVSADGSAGGAATNATRIDADLTGLDFTSATLGFGDLTTAANAETEFDLISGDPSANTDGLLGTLSDGRSEVGALISRFEFRSDVIATSLENITAANSAILDADIAAEQTKFTNYETLTEAAIAGLAKANELPSQLLRLLQ